MPTSSLQAEAQEAAMLMVSDQVVTDVCFLDRLYGGTVLHDTSTHKSKKQVRLALL